MKWNARRTHDWYRVSQKSIPSTYFALTDTGWVRSPYLLLYLPWLIPGGSGVHTFYFICPDWYHVASRTDTFYYVCPDCASINPACYQDQEPGHIWEEVIYNMKSAKNCYKIRNSFIWWFYMMKAQVELSFDKKTKVLIKVSDFAVLPWRLLHARSMKHSVEVMFILCPRSLVQFSL